MKSIHFLNKRKPYIDTKDTVADLLSHMGGKCKNGVVGIVIVERNGFEQLIKKQYEKEGYNVKIIDSINGEFENNSIGRIDIFVNYLCLNYNTKTYDGSNIEWYYRVCQVEGDYFIQNKLEGHIVNICKNLTRNVIIVDLIKTLTQGLGYALGNHNIIINGVIGNEEISDIVLISWGMYLSGKYGDFLAGNVLLLTDCVCEESIPYMQ